ncbi:MAG: hypothetical protein RL266_1020 [Bacteroidota bacterium]|jgi:antitoxin component YwqK of YwqJK toxin-antitoxin module/tetratricopeptide (TPR) repeat protein
MKAYNLTLALIISFFMATGQQRQFTDQTKILEDYSDHLAEKEYQKALDDLLKVPVYDSLYEAVALEIVSLHIELKNYEEALAVCDWGIRNKGESLNLFYQNRGAIYNKMGNPDRAIKSNEAALKIFPELIQLKYNTAIALKDKGEYAKAMKLYQEVIQSNPYFSSAHFELGQMALRDNETARAIMCFNTYLICEDSYDKRNWVLRYLNEIVTTKKDSIPKGLFEESEESFSKINLILDNYVALDKSYKTGTKHTSAVIKQNHLLFTKLAELPKDQKGFWNEFYVPLYAALMKDGMFPYHAIYTLRASGNEDHLKLVEKKAGDVQKMRDWLIDHLSKNWSIKKTDDPNLDQVRVFHDNNVLRRTGLYDNSKQAAVGNWQYFKDNGLMNSEGVFKVGKQDGLWRWYHRDGTLKEETTMKDDKVNGTMKFFFTNGKLRSEADYTDGVENGMYKEYYENGKLMRTAKLKDGKATGPLINYFANGVLADSTQMVEGDKTGPFRYYFNDGSLRITGDLKKGERQGTIKEYYQNGQLESEYSYNADGKATGSYKEYFINGSVSAEGELKDGNRIGKHVVYNLNGTKYSESNYDETGKENGGRIFFDHQNRPHEEYVYAKGLITQYKFFDTNGNVIKEAKKKGSGFEYESVHFDGTQKSAGTFNVKGGKEGLWKFYNSDGVLESEQRFSENEQQGKQTYYHANGKVESEYEIVDGKDEGEFKRYYFDGQLKRHGRFSEGQKVGEWFDYYEDGTLAEIEYYVDDKITYQIEYNVEGKPNIEMYYVDDLIEHILYYDTKGGIVDTFYFVGGDGKLDYKFENGKPQVTGNHLYGYRHGPYKYHEFDGRVSSEGNYVLGELDGAWTYAHENGQRSETATFVYGKKHGPYQRWDWFGNLESEGEYFYGDLHGIRKTYYPNGKMESASEYEYGYLNGKREFFSPAGELQMIRYYDHGVLTAYSYLGPDNKPVEPIKVNRLKDRLVAYFPNGKISREYDFVNGMIQGLLIEYMSNGKKSYEGNFIDDEGEGKRITYFASGGIYEEMNYAHGVLEGTHTFYWESGKKRLELPYKLGKKHGKGVEYDKNGTPKTEYTFFNNQLIGEKKL